MIEPSAAPASRDVLDPSPSVPRDLVGIIGLTAAVFGLAALQDTFIGFDRAKAIEALVTWAPVTVPPALLVLAVTAFELLTGLILARLLLGRPLRDPTEALLAGFAGAVVKSVVLLGLLAGFGLFTAPVLVAVDVLVLVAWRWRRGADGGPRLRDLIDDARMPTLRISPFGILLLVAWAPPIVKMLGAPVAPFLDILPNHVAPAEHLRTFGAMASLTDTWSPLYGPSRSFLGYTALLGTITTISGLHASAAVAAFVLPATLLVAATVSHIARVLGGPRLVGWALLTFAVSVSMSRLGDARATVVVLPLVALAFALALDGGATGGRRWAAGMTMTIGAAALFHPALGFLTALVVASLAVALRPARGALVVGLVGGAIVALPQLATMVGVSLPPIALSLATALGLALAWIGGDRLSSAGSRFVGAVRSIAPIAVAVFAAVTLIGATWFTAAAVDALEPYVVNLEVSLVLVAIALGVRGTNGRLAVAWLATGLGVAVAIAVRLIPEDLSLLGDALRFELPKTLHHWFAMPVALLAAGALLRLHDAGSHTTGVRRWAAAGVLVASIVALAFPWRAEPIHPHKLGEHRIAETVSISLEDLQNGFWRQHPDPRYVIDEPRREIVEEVRAEIAAGRIGATAAILHVASSYLETTATPLGPFTGVAETIVSADAVTNIHTVGGRLFGFGDLDRLLGSGEYAYVLLEPSDDGDRQVPPDARDRILAAGYVPFFSNAQGELFRTGG